MYLWRQLLGFRLQPPGARDPFGGSGQRIFCEFLAGRMPGESGCRSLSTMFRSSFFEKGDFFTGQCTRPAECKNAGHPCVAGVDTRTYGTYLGAVSLGRPLINNG
jgi:hypothetical protein